MLLPIEQWISPLLLVFGVTVFGLLFKLIIHSRIQKAVLRSEWQGDDIFISSIESQITFWFFLLGSSIALKDSPIPEDYASYVSNLLHILLIASITHASAKLVVGVLKLWSNKQGGGFPSTTIFTNIVWITVLSLIHNSEPTRPY